MKRNVVIWIYPLGGELPFHLEKLPFELEKEAFSLAITPALPFLRHFIHLFLFPVISTMLYMFILF